MELPDFIRTEDELDAFLATPYPELVTMMRRLDGDILVLGVGGKMGPSLARLAANACREGGVRKRVIGVSRFSDGSLRSRLESAGIETTACDLLDPEEVRKLPQARNVIFMVGRKFGVVGSESLTWATNAIAPANVARTFRQSRIVAFSTGCVYPLVPPSGRGSRETDPLDPVGEYSQACVARERIFEHYAEQYGTAVLLFRLNYAIDLRYGVLFDIAQNVHAGTPVDLSVGVVNIIWQGDANNRALLCLEHTANPPAVLNVTGGETLFVRDLTEQFAERFGTAARFCGTDSERAYLSDASRSIQLFGPPQVPVAKMIEWTAEWIKRGGRSLGKPTHFTVTDGQFLSQR